MKKILMLTAFTLAGLAGAQDTNTTTTETTTTTQTPSPVVTFHNNGTVNNTNFFLSGL